MNKKFYRNDVTHMITITIIFLLISIWNFEFGISAFISFIIITGHIYHFDMFGKKEMEGYESTSAFCTEKEWREQYLKSGVGGKR